jgi:hypothetical protein
MLKKFIAASLIATTIIPATGAFAAENTSDTLVTAQQSPTVVSANVDSSLINYVESELSAFIQNNDLKVSIDDFRVTLRDDIDISKYTIEEKQQLLEKDISNMKEQLLSTDYSLTTPINEDQIVPRIADLGNGEYTAEIWSGVPAVGWSTVKQDFKASISNGKVKSITFLGDGYMDGVSWGKFNHIRSWETIYDNGAKVDIYIKGSINYTWNLINSDYTSTFKEELKVDNGKLIRQW